MTRRQSRARFIPNILSIFRVLACPLIIYFYDRGTPGAMWAGLILFIAGSLSDMLDGKIARAYKVESRLGRIIDPIADKLLVLSALYALFAMDMIFLWLLVGIMLRDVLVTVLRLVKTKSDAVISPTVWAKGKTMYQMISLGVLLFWPIVLDVPLSSFISLPNILLYPVLLMTWATAIPYFRAFFSRRG